jgi:Flp pilus assembly protein TadD
MMVLAVLSVRQTDVWESTETLWSFTYQRSGAISGNVANNWGAVLLQQRRYAEAAEVLSRAVVLSPRNAKAFHNLGIALTYTGADAAASAAFAEEIRLSGRTAVVSPPPPFRSSR